MIMIVPLLLIMMIVISISYNIKTDSDNKNSKYDNDTLKILEKLTYIYAWYLQLACPIHTCQILKYMLGTC